MKTILIFLNAFLVAASIDYTTFKRNDILGNRIYNTKVIGGSDAKRHQFPYIVSLHFLEDHVCGGSILSPNWVVTAGHCCDMGLLMFCSRYTVIAGMLNQNESHADIQRITVKRYILHPRYYYSGVEIDNDIALLQLTSPFKFTIAVQPINLPIFNQTFQEGWLSGWGVYKRPESMPVTLQYLKMPLITNEECKNVLKNFEPSEQLPLYETMICAMPPEGPESACNGDSGGPFAADNGVLIGISSWAVWCKAYKEGAPTVLTRVSSYIEFIRHYVTN